jgi:hypothetical protein
MTALAEAGGPCTNGAEKYAPNPSFAAAFAWLVGPGLKTTLETAKNSMMATAIVRRVLMGWVMVTRKLHKCMKEASQLVIRLH